MRPSVVSVTVVSVPTTAPFTMSATHRRRSASFLLLRCSSTNAKCARKICGRFEAASPSSMRRRNVWGSVAPRPPWA
jgi:hypothetical protein